MNRSAGFTLVEMVTATALSALLTVALVRVTASLSRVRAVMAEPIATPSWIARFDALLATDLSQARSSTIVGPDDGGPRLVLEGPLGLGGGERRRHGPVRVTYRMIAGADSGAGAGAGLLVREELDLLDRSNRPSRRRLLCTDVGDFAVSLPAVEDSRAGTSSLADADDTSIGLLSYQITLRSNPNDVIEGELPVRGHGP